MRGILFTAIIAACFGASGDVVNKYLLSKLKLSLRDYLPYVFILLTAVSLLIIPVGFYFNSDGFNFTYLILFLLMCGSAIVWNVLLAKSMQSEPLHEYELIILTAPLVTVLLAAVFLPEERNFQVILVGIVASLALIFTRIRKHHLVLSKSAKRTFLAVIFIAIEAILLKKLLVVFSPAFLYFCRVLILAIVFYIYYKPKNPVLKFTPVRTGLIVASICGTGVMVLKYYAFRSIGVVETTVILLLAPVLTYLASYFYFKERQNFKRDLACAIVIIGCIIYSTLAR